MAHRPCCLLDAGIHAARVALVGCGLYPLTELDPVAIGVT